MLFKDVATLVGIAQDQVVHGQCVFEIFGTKMQVSANPLGWLDTLALMNVDLIHNPGHQCKMC